MLTALWRAILDLVFPPRCPACRTDVTTHGQWCGTCASQVVSPREINRAKHQLQALDACFAVADYTGSLQRIMRDMKFRKMQRYGTHLGWLLEQYTDWRRLGIVDLAIPVPLHATRLTERGFNQTEVIFKDWARKQGWQWLDGLIRLKATSPQWELTLQERKRNIKGAFIITRQIDLRDKTILLVDDIITSGITMEECAKTLKQAGARRVVGLALASGDK